MVQRANSEKDFINKVNELCLRAVDAIDRVAPKAIENDSSLGRRLVEDSKHLSELLKEQNNYTNLLILGDTNSGKSTLGCFLTNGCYFKPSNMAETYYPTQVLNVSNDNAPPYRIERYIKDDEEIKCEVTIPENEEECHSQIETFKREAGQNENIIDVKIHVKNLANESGLEESLVVQDTPGVSEVDYRQATKDVLDSYWGSSIVLYVVDSGCGTLNLSNLKTLLSVFKENNCTERIIFVFTKILNHIQCCKPSSFSALKKSDASNRLELAINKANETLHLYQKQIMDYYPNAQFILFDQDEEQCGEYFYRKGVLKYEHKKETPSDKDFVNIGYHSIEYLKELINNLANKSLSGMIVTKQQNKLSIIKEAITTTYSLFSTLAEVSKKVNKFNQEAELIFKEAKESYEHEVIKRFDLDPEVRGPNSAFYKFVSETLQKLDKEDSEVRLSKSNYTKHLSEQLGKKVQEYLQKNISEIYTKIFDEGTEKLQKLLQEFINPAKEQNDPSTTNNKLQNINDQTLLALGGAAGSAALVGCVGWATSQTLVWAFGVKMSVSAATAMGVESAAAAGSVFLGGLSGAATLGVGLAISATIGGVIYVSWKRSTVVDSLTKAFYKDFTENETFKKNLIEAGHKVIDTRLAEVQTTALSLFEPKEDNIPGCPSYSCLCQARDEIAKEIQEFKSCN